jgi:hypothetical protein
MGLPNDEAVDLNLAADVLEWWSRLLMPEAFNDKHLAYPKSLARSDKPSCMKIFDEIDYIYWHLKRSLSATNRLCFLYYHTLLTDWYSAKLFSIDLNPKTDATIVYV